MPHPPSASEPESAPTIVPAPVPDRPPNPAPPTLAELGWNTENPPDVPDGLIPARVVSQARGQVHVATGSGQLTATIAGRLLHNSRSGELPTVGDWVAIRPRTQEGTATIQAVLPRHSAITRKVSGTTTEAQIIAANVDLLIIAMAFGHDFNVRRLERYLATAWESGATPLVVLTKADIVGPAEEAVGVFEAEQAAPGVTVIALSSVDGRGMDEVRAQMGPGVTVAVIGSSGVGKSTLVNRLASEERMATGEIRGDGRGRHTTVHRQLLILAGGEILIDTPGLREIQLWDAEGGSEATFADVEDIARHCKFSDCRHNKEPGCAVRLALADGTLDAGRFAGWEKIQHELAFLARQQDARLRIEERNKWKKLSNDAKTRSRP